jgi:hypothetical protein
MKFRCLKVLEKAPEVMGFNLGVVAVIVVCGLGFLFTVFSNFFISLIFPITLAIYFFFDKKFPGKGELNQYIQYIISEHCIKFNQQIKCLIKTK